MVDPLSAGTVIGLLIRYANGDRASVGSFRFDWAGEPVHVAETGWLYLAKALKGRYIQLVQNSRPPEDTKFPLWMRIPLWGKLECWSGFDGIRLTHIHIQDGAEPR